MSLFQKIRARASQKISYLEGDIRHILGVDKGFYRNARGSRIVLYHGICKTDHTRFNTLFLTAQTFEEHLKYYQKYFHVVSLDDFYARNFNPDKFNICLTFDDGFANNYRYVLPLLTKYQMPAAFFITAIRNTGHNILWNDFMSLAGKYGPAGFTFNDDRYHKNHHNKYVNSAGIPLTTLLRASGFKDKERLMDLLDPLVNFKTNGHDDDYWQQLTGKQIRALAASVYVTIGSHGYYHNDLSQIDPADASREMVMSKQYLENITGKPVSSIAFPYGAYNLQALAIAQAAGYKQLLATDFISPAYGHDPLMRERFTVNPFISTANQVRAIIKNKYE